MRTVIFHGTAMPDRDWAGGLEADVVLQPYHAIVQAQELCRVVPSRPPVRLRQPDGGGPGPANRRDERHGLPRPARPLGPPPVAAAGVARLGGHRRRGDRTSAPVWTVSSSTTSTGCSRRRRSGTWRSATSIGSPMRLARRCTSTGRSRSSTRCRPWRPCSSRTSIANPARPARRRGWTRSCCRHSTVLATAAFASTDWTTGSTRQAIGPRPERTRSTRLPTRSRACRTRVWTGGPGGAPTLPQRRSPDA